MSNYAPLYNENKQVFAVASFSKDISEMMKAKKLADSLLFSSQQQAEELKAQEEEMRQNMEELAATQDELENRAAEIEEIRRIEKERADSQIASQKKIMEQFMQKTKDREAQLVEKVKKLEAQLHSKILVQ